MFITNDDYHKLNEMDILQSKKHRIISDYLLAPIKTAYNQIHTLKKQGLYGAIAIDIDIASSNYFFTYTVADAAQVTILIKETVPSEVFCNEGSRSRFIRIVCNKFIDIKDTLEEMDSASDLPRTNITQHKPSIGAVLAAFWRK